EKGAAICCVGYLPFLFGLRKKKQVGPAISEFFPTTAHKRFAHAEKGADGFARDLPLDRCEHHHSSLTIYQAVMVKMIQQEGEVRDAFRLADEGANLQILLKHLPHPLDVEEALALSVFSCRRSSNAPTSRTKGWRRGDGIGTLQRRRRSKSRARDLGRRVIRS